MALVRHSGPAYHRQHERTHRGIALFRKTPAIYLSERLFNSEAGITPRNLLGVW
jgi:hypothetical protein